MESDFDFATGENDDSKIPVELESISSNDSSLADFGDRSSTDASEYAGQINIRAVDEDDSRGSLNLGEDSPSKVFPPTALVIRLDPKITPEGVRFLIKKIKSPRGEGGAELLVRCEPFSHSPGEQFVLHVTADTLRYLEVAEYLGIKKTDDKGDIREFLVKDMESFLRHEGVTLETLVTPAEQIFIVLHELQAIKAIPGERFIPSYPKIELHTGQSIFQVYLLENLIHSYFPLHNPKDIRRLVRLVRQNWFNALRDTELFDEIRRYFGDSITMFFLFSGFYTKVLVVPASLSLVRFLFSAFENTSIVFFSIFNLVCTSVALKLWRRKCSSVAYTWGTMNLNKWDVEPRLFYTGKIAVDPVTGQYRPRYPWWRTALKTYLFSWPCVGFFMTFATFLCLLYFISIDWVKPYKEMYSEPYHGLVGISIGLIPSTVYAIVVSRLTAVYRQIMRSLTEWENHRTQPQFDKYLVPKLVTFESINNFSCFFYIAFILMDLSVLSKQLFTMLVILHILVGFQEIVLPIFLKRTSTTVQVFLVKTKEATRKFHRMMSPRISKGIVARPNNPNARDFQDLEWNPKILGIIELDSDDPRVAMSQMEREMDPYGDCFDDYQQLFIQFGYAFLFSPVVPWGILIALITNFFVIYANIYKLCYVYQRPIPKRVKDIGAWQNSFDFISYLCVITNIALIVIAFDIRKWSMFAQRSDFYFFFIIVSIEHLLVFLKLCFYYGVSNVPYEVALATSKLEYKARVAFKKEQQLKSRKRLTLRYQAINVDMRQHFRDEDEGSNASTSRHRSNVSNQRSNVTNQRSNVTNQRSNVSSHRSGT